MGSCLTLGNELSEETRAYKAGDVVGKGHPGGEQEGKGTPENYCATWLAGSGFMVMRLVSRLSLADCSSWWCAHRLAKIDSSEEDSGRSVGHTDWHLLSPFDFSQILPVSGSLLVLHSLPGPPVVKITHASGYHGAWPGRAVSVFPPTVSVIHSTTVSILVHVYTCTCFSSS